MLRCFCFCGIIFNFILIKKKKKTQKSGVFGVSKDREILDRGEGLN